MLGADLSRPFHGVRSALPTPTEPAAAIEDLARAFQRGAPDHAFVCGISAAVILRIPLAWRHERSRMLHVGAPAPHRAPKAHGTVGRKLQIRPDELWVRGDIRMTTPERTWCDLAAVLSVPDLVAAGDYLIHWELPHTSEDALRTAVAQWGGRAGAARLRQAIGMLNDHSESRRESLLRVVVAQARIRGVVANEWITTSGGYRYRDDLVIRESKVIIEYQSRFHDGTKEFADDMTRISRLEADHWYVIQVNNRDLAHPVELVQRIRKVLADQPRPLPH
jgi:very-short-patch-repair endonuclease